MTDNELVDPKLFKISEVGLSVVGKPTFDQIQDEFVKWALVHRVSAFALGDLISEVCCSYLVRLRKHFGAYVSFGCVFLYPFDSCRRVSGQND